MADKAYPMPPSDAAAPPRKARPVRLPPHISGASAFRRVMRAALEHLAENEPAAIAGADVEGVHQARVAIRRLRSALVLFEDYAGATAALDFRKRLRDAARVLGEGRDWDVFLTETLPHYTADCPDNSVRAIVPIAGRLRATAHRHVRRALGDEAHRALIAEIANWVSGESWRSGLGLRAFRGLDESCRDLATPLLDRAAKRVKKRGRDIGNQTPEERHTLRKAMKKLRYSSEFLSSLYPTKKVRRYLAAVEEIQDVLGALNDVAATVSLLDRLAVENGQNLPELDAFRAWARAGSSHEIHRLDKVWRHFSKADPFWD